MPRVTIELPSLLRQVVSSNGSIGVDATTVAEALRAAVSEHPGLEVHLFDETGGLRQHVLCFHNQTNTRWHDSLEKPVAEGDVLTILQAVSGG
jgi:molybdopterin converting factor small subunit